MNTKEIWKDIIGYIGYYQVSSFGNIRSVDRYVISKIGTKRFFKGINLKPVLCANGYFYVSLSKNGKMKRNTIHRLVAINFIENPLNKPNINHKNAIPTDNNVYNLEWCTQSENVIHAQKLGLWNQALGEQVGTSKLNTNKVKEIRLMLKNNLIQKEIAQKFGVDQSVISDIKRCKIWTHVQ